MRLFHVLLPLSWACPNMIVLTWMMDISTGLCLLFNLLTLICVIKAKTLPFNFYCPFPSLDFRKRNCPTLGYGYAQTLVLRVDQAVNVISCTTLCFKGG